MEKIKKELTIIATRFHDVGNGISAYTTNNRNALLKYSSYKINTIEVKEYFKIGERQQMRAIENTLNRLIYFYGLGFKTDMIKDKNVHIVCTGVLPAKFLKLPKKKIITVHDLYIFEPNFLGDWKRKLYFNTFGRHFYTDFNHMREYDHIITGSETLKEKISKRFDYPLDKITIINSIINDEIYKPFEKEGHDDKTIIGYLNSYGPNKAKMLKVFIQEFMKVKDDSFELHFYGRSFPFSELIKNDKRIKYFGPVAWDENKVAEMYKTFDVYLQTSYLEGIGIPPLKAKAMNIPVICYDGDLPILTKGNTVLWSKPEEIEDILKNRLWEKVDLIKAHKDAEECSPMKVAQKLENIYDEVFDL